MEIPQAAESSPAPASHAASAAPRRVRRSAMRRARARAAAAQAESPRATAAEPPAPVAAPVADAPPPGGSRLRRGATTRREFSSGLVAVVAGTRAWVFFLAVLGFLYVGLGLLMTGVAVVGMVSSGGAGSPVGLLMIIALVAQTVVCFLPTWFLLKYARGIREFTAAPDDAHLVSALHAQQRFFRVLGVYVLIGLLLAIAVVAFLIATGVPLPSGE